MSACPQGVAVRLPGDVQEQPPSRQRRPAPAQRESRPCTKHWSTLGSVAVAAAATKWLIGRSRKGIGEKSNESRDREIRVFLIVCFYASAP